MEINLIEHTSVYQQTNSIQTQTSQPVEHNSNEKIEASTPKDEYISSEKSSEKPSGLYKLVPDKNGTHKIIYDAPTKLKENQSKQPQNTIANSPNTQSENCTINTDNVDQEIKALKQQKKELEQQIKTAIQNGEETKDLEKKLAAIENELKQKDNDAYRQQNAFIS